MDYVWAVGVFLVGLGLVWHLRFVPFESLMGFLH